MSDAPNTDAPAVPASAPADTPAPADAGAPPADSAPKWDGEFDAERAAKLIANLRDEAKGYKSQLSEVQTKLSQHEQAQMTELEKAVQRATSAETELSKVRREKAVSEALRDHGLPKSAARFISGETAEEITEAAKAFAELSNAAAPPEGDTLPPTLPIPGNGSDPSAVRQLTREEAEKLPPAQLLEAYRAGRLRSIGGR
jgi:hypothetical protein